MYSLLLVVISVFLATAFPQRFDPLSLAGNYVINGTFYAKNQLISSPPVAAFLVLDSQNGQMRLHMGTGGDYWLYPDKTYVTDIPTLGGYCTTLSWNYTSQLTSYAHAFYYDRFGVRTLWGNMVKDVGSCGYDVSVSILKKEDVITTWQFGQVFPIPGRCLFVEGVLEFEERTLSRDRALIDSLMSPSTLPANCATPLPYCTLAYPPGNACGAPPGI